MPRGKTGVIQYTVLENDIVEDGDIILRLGNRLWSQVFSNVSLEDRRFSHLGIIRICNDQISVIHAEGTTNPGEDYVKEDALEKFLIPAMAVGVFRFKNVDKQKISEYALEYIGVPFDWQFDLQDNSRIYCTELLFLILQRIEPTIELSTQYIGQLGRYIIPLEAVSNSEYFYEVYFHQLP